MTLEMVPRPGQGRVFDAGRRIRLADSSAAGRLRFDAMARYLQDIANDNAREAESPNFNSWVARRTVIDVTRFPRYLDTLKMATWCSGIGSHWAERRYSIVADDRAPDDSLGVDSVGGRIEAVTLWVHIDLESMRPIPLPAGFSEHFGEAAGGRVVGARQQLPARPPDTEDAHRSLWPTRFVDFDVLGHVNNSVYWAMVEEQLARRRDVRAPLTVTLEHRDAIGPDTDVTMTTVDTANGFDLWIGAASGPVAAVARAETRVSS